MTPPIPHGQRLAIPPGTQLGRYEIAGPVGAGGMGEVYRARDTELHRTVAIKVLPPLHATAPDRLERFAREARAAATINHPNILVVYDVGSSSHGPFLVSELLDGQTLREAAVPGRPWPVRKALDLAVPLAKGLAAAHACGVVHRDLKPENILLTDAGVVKILDFGLARLTEPLLTPGAATDSVTRDGTVLGSAGYMAPEQVRGQPADHRADIFAFGTILYELLTGQRAFAGDSSADVMSAVLTRDPPELATLAQHVPPALARIVVRCLEKRPDARFQAASDLAFALEALSGADTAIAGSAPAGTRRGPIPHAALVAAVVLAIVTAFFIGTRIARDPMTPVAPHVLRLTDLAGLEETPALSPDGRSVVFTAERSGRRQVFVRSISGGPSLQVTSGAGDHQFPRWSADSESIVYFSPAAPGELQGALFQISALGGSPRRLTESLGGADMHHRDGRLAYFRLAEHGVELVTSASDASDVRVVAPMPSASYYWYPRWSPDGRWIAFQRGDGVRFDVFAVPHQGGELRQLTSDNTLMSGLSWLPDSSGIVYSSSRGSTMPYLPTFALWEARFGDEQPRPMTSHDVSYVHPDVHRTGVTVAGRVQMRFDIWQFPVDGSPADNVRRGVRRTHQTGHVQTPTVSPAGDEVAFLSDSGGHANLWVMRLDGGDLRQITSERDPAVAIGVPVWSPDGRSIAFVYSRGNPGLAFGVWLVNPDGSHLRQLVPRGFGAAWSPDSQWVYFVERADDALRKVPVGGGQVVTVRPEPTRSAIGAHGRSVYYLVERPLVDGRPEFDIRMATPEDGPSRLLARIPASRVASWQIVNPAMSPDGEWLAQALTDGFTTNIWALSTSTGQWRQITDFGERVTFIARRVAWSSDSRSIVAAVGEGDADVVLIDRLVPAADR